MNYFRVTELLESFFVQHDHGLLQYHFDCGSFELPPQTTTFIPNASLGLPVLHPDSGPLVWNWNHRRPALFESASLRLHLGAIAKCDARPRGPSHLEFPTERTPR